jgi:iron(II)-dependent oxidoreductase
VTTEALAERLERVRMRTVELFEPLRGEAITRAPDPIMSPPLWDLGHIAAYEELWLVRRLGGRDALHPELDAVYDAFETPRAVRGDAPLLEEGECRAFLGEVRERALAVLAGADVDPGADPLTANGFAFDLVAVHEAQHTETVLQAMQMLPAGGYAPPRDREPHGRARDEGPSWIDVAGGDLVLGAGEAERFAYDCERPAHVRALAPFRIARRAVTEAEWAEFVRDGGYEREGLWSEEGREWRREVGATAPAYWSPDGEGGWLVRRYERVEPVREDVSVCHVSAHEADAFARWAGARLPSEAEWEAAARASAATDAPAELDQLAFGPGGGAPNDDGCEGMIGDVWEWTSSGFEGYPGFRAFPYREYAEVFFGGPYRVLRGGSWATQPHAVSETFRNWDLPRRRQIFAGVRLARDAEGAA